MERLVPGWQEVVQAWQQPAGDVVSLQLAGVVRHVHGVLLQRFQRHHLEGGLMGGGKHNRRGAAVVVGSQPVDGGDAPAVSRHEAGETVLRHRLREVVADGALVLQELGGHDGADGVQSDVLGTRRAAAVTVEAGERIVAARFKRATQRVAICHRFSMNRHRRSIAEVHPADDQRIGLPDDLVVLAVIVELSEQVPHGINPARFLSLLLTMLRDSSRGRVFRVYRDRGSGLRESRRGLDRLLDDAAAGRFTVVRVVWRDRLARFGVAWIERYLSVCGVNVEALHDRGDTSLLEELMDDFMALLASFSGRFYQLRSTHNQRRLLDAAGQRLGDERG